MTDKLASIKAMVDLAEGAEKAGGPDREIDAAIEAVLQLNAPGRLVNYIGPFDFDGDNDDGSVTVWVGKKKVARYRPPAFTASLDAAMSLIPEGWHVSDWREDWRAPNRWSCTLSQRPNEGQIAAYDAGGTFGAQAEKGEAATPALAMVSACLRARAAS